MASKLTALAKDTFVFAVGSGLTKLILFLLLPLFTRVMTTQSYGIAELICNVLQVVFPALSLCITEAVFRYAIDESEEMRDRIFRFGCVVLLIDGFLVAIIGTLLYLVFDYEYGLDFIILYVSYSTAQLLKNYSRGLGHSKLFALSGVCGAITVTITSFLFLLALNLDIHGYLMAFSSGYVVEIILVGLKERRSIKLFGPIGVSAAKEALRFSLPDVPNMISWWITNVSTRYFILWDLGASAAGLFTAASKFAAVVNLLTDVFQKAWQYSSSREIEGDDNKYFNDAFVAYQSILIVATSMAIAITPILCAIALSDDFYVAWTMVPFLIIAASINGLSKFFGTFYLAAKQNFMAMVSTVVGAITCLIGCVVLIPLFGVAGALAANIAAYSLIAIIRIVDTRRYIEISVNAIRVSSSFILLFMQAVALVLSNGSILTSMLFFVVCLALNYRPFYLLLKALLNTRRNA